VLAPPAISLSLIQQTCAELELAVECLAANFDQFSPSMDNNFGVAWQRCVWAVKRGEGRCMAAAMGNTQALEAIGEQYDRLDRQMSETLRCNGDVVRTALNAHALMNPEAPVKTTELMLGMLKHYQTMFRTCGLKSCAEGLEIKSERLNRSLRTFQGKLGAMRLQ
jgi:hypothetical protein